MFRFRIQIVLVLIVFLAAGNAVYQANRTGQPAPITGEKWLVELSLWPTRWFAWPFRQADKVWDRYVALVGVSKENETLKRRLAELEVESTRLKEVELSYGRLKSLLEFRETLPHAVMGAEVIARTDDGTSAALFIATGVKKGVSADSAVVGLGGLVGRVVTASRDYARVLPLTDGSSAAGAVVQRSRVQAVVKGSGRNRCRLEHVPVNSDVGVGDAVVTSGLDGLFPPGLMIGLVSRVERPAGAFFAEIELVPAVRMSQLEEVLVVSPGQGGEVKNSGGLPEGLP